MVFHILYLALACLMPTIHIYADQNELQPQRQLTLNESLQHVQELFNSVMQELDETQRMFHTTCKEANDREMQLKHEISNLQEENQNMMTVKAELAMAQKDLEQSQANENRLQHKLVHLEQAARDRITSIQEELDTVQNKLETTSSSLGKVFW